MDHSQTETNLRIPPHSIEAEQSVLGGLMVDANAWEKVADLINSDDFYRHDHRLIFRAITVLNNQNVAVDILVVKEYLEQHNQLQEVGEFAYLITLAQSTPSASNIRYYAEIVRERSITRQLAKVGTEIADNAYNPQGKTTAQLLDEAENKVFQIAENTINKNQDFLDMPNILANVIQRISDLSKRESNELTGISTGFIDLDRLTSGLQKGDLIIIAGRPSMGKTAFAVNIAEHVALKEKKPVAIFSMEMSADQLLLRILSSVARIDQSALRNGKLEDEHWTALNSAVVQLSDTQMFIDETANLTALDIRARSRRLARKFGGQLGLIVIDYLQLMAGSTSQNKGNRVMELGEISRTLKALAKELQVPVIALSQLSRSVEQRNDKRPIMSDLRESGSIEQDADIVMLMYRKAYYESKEKGKPIAENDNSAECIVAKHRNGSVADLPLVFLGPYTRFETGTRNNNKHDEFYD